MKKLILLAFCLFYHTLYTPILAQDSNKNIKIDPIRLSPDQDIRFINDSIRVFYTLDTLSGEQAWERIKKGVLTENIYKEKAQVNLADKGFWLLIKFRNNIAQKSEYYLEVAYNRTDLIHFFEIKNDSAQLKYTTGDTFNFSQRPIVHRNFVFPIKFAQNEEKLFLVNLEKRNTVDRFPLKIYPVAKFESYKDTENLIFGLFFGIILLILIVSVGLFLYTGLNVFVYYGLYATSIGLYLFTSLGLTFQLITPNYPDLNYINLGVLIPVSLVLMIRFCQAYFNSKRHFPIINKIYNFLIINFVLQLAVWALVPDFYQRYSVNILYYTYVVILSVFVVSFITAYLFRKINKINSILFGLGYTASFIGIGYAILIDTGTIFSSIFIDSSLSILTGFFVEFVFLTSAMAVYIRRKIKYFDYTVGFQRTRLGNGKKMVQNNGAKANRDTNEQKAIAEKNNNKIKQLTEREQEILHLIATGKTSQEIAELLFISIHTIQTHRKHIWKKLDIKSYNQLLTIANAFEEV